MDGGVHTTMGSAPYIPLTMVRIVVRGGVARLKHIIGTNGFKTGTCNAEIARLVGSLKVELHKHFFL